MVNLRPLLQRTALALLITVATIQPAHAQVRNQTQNQAQSAAQRQAQAQAQMQAQMQAQAQSRSNNRRNLPVCQLDSFVKQAGGQAEQIYGDEGQGNSPPPYFKFTEQHRIGTGINGSGLTTGHGSMMPSAWGGDEFIGAEWVNTSQGNAAYYGNTGGGTDLSGQIAQYNQAVINALNNNNLSDQQLQDALSQQQTQLQSQMESADGF